MLPTREEISIGKTKNHVSRQDIDNFNSWLISLNDVVKPFEERARNCNNKKMIEDGHVIETSIDLLNDEIIRIIHWARRDQITDTEKAAKNYKELKDRYIDARHILQNNCNCTMR